MNILFINPHRSDFIFNSPLYSLFGRRSLKKYGYLSKLCDSNNVEYRFLSSSFYSLLNKIGFRFLDKFVLKLEVNLFYKINNLSSVSSNTQRDKYYDFVFCFGFSIRDLDFDELYTIAINTKFFFIHLSHYHLYANLLNKWCGLPNVIFCADSDIRNNYIFKYYVENCPPFEVISFIPDLERFKIFRSPELRINKVVATGTFHKFEKSEKGSSLNDNLLVKPFGLLSLHPERRLIFSFSENLKFIKTYISELEPSSILSLFFGLSKIKQKDYFKIDIVQIYNDYKFAFVGEEVTGVLGIGIIEATLSGCIPIIKRSCYVGTPFENSQEVIYYETFEDLLGMLNSDDLNNHYKCIDMSKSELVNRILSFYSSDTQISNILKVVSNNG